MADVRLSLADLAANPARAMSLSPSEASALFAEMAAPQLVVAASLATNVAESTVSERPFPRGQRTVCLPSSRLPSLPACLAGTCTRWRAGWTGDRSSPIEPPHVALPRVRLEEQAGRLR